MKPVSVRFQCFGPYMAEQFIDFEELEKNGLFLISGETGAGKTTILDAMCYALYGRSSGGLRGDLSVMRCKLAEKDQETLTEFVFDCGGKRYKFTRSLKYGRKNLNDSHNCLVWEDGVWVPIFENPKATYVNQKAQELIGLTYDQFRQVIILPQGQFEKLLVSDSAEKEKILVSLFHADRWQKIADELYRRVADQDTQLKQEKLQFSAKLREYGCEDLAALEAKTAIQAQLVTDLEDQCRAAEARMQTAQERSRVALVENKEFEEFARIRRQKNQLEGKLPAFAAEEELLRQADAAQLLRPAYQQYQDARNQKLRAENLAGQAEQALSAARANLAAVQQKKQAHDADREDQEQRKSHLLTLKNARQLYATLAQKELAARTARQNYLRTKETLTHAEETFARLDAAWQQAILAQKDAIGSFQKIQSAYLLGIGSTLAEKLIQGEPCPVCGSTHHPNPARAGEDHVSEAMVQRADRAMKAANEAASAAMEQRSTAEKQRTQALEAANLAHQTYAQAQSALDAAQAGLIPGIGGESQLEQQIRLLEKAAAAYEKEESDLMQILTDTQGREAAARERLTAASEELLAAQSSYSIQAASWQRALAGSGFESENTFRRADLDPQEKQRRTMALLQFRTDLAQAKQMLEEKQQTLAGRVMPDMEAIRKELAEAEKSFRNLSGQQLLAAENRKKMEQTGKSLAKAMESYTARRQQVDGDLDFANRLRGRSGVSLQRYVLGVMLTSVTAEANRLLGNVYGGRYRLYRTDEISGSGHKGGLELEVYDSQNNQKRSVTTLSGGEKFLVALSLAIGLSTVVQARGSGIRLEAMFIDEGFGSLDREAVQDALEILQGIQRGSGIVGIISHVEQLAEIIPTRLEITKGKQGSICHIRT